MYKCRECGCVFEEPRNWVERHGLECGPYEEWSACPNCLSPDYDDEYIVRREEEDDDQIPASLYNQPNPLYILQVQQVLSAGRAIGCPHRNLTARRHLEIKNGR